MSQRTEAPNTVTPAPRDAVGETVERLREYADREQRVRDGWHAHGATSNALSLHDERIALARDAAREIAALRARCEAAERALDDHDEHIARAIYDAMRDHDPEGKHRPWVAGGNSIEQDEARSRARAALAAARGGMTTLTTTAPAGREEG